VTVVTVDSSTIDAMIMQWVYIAIGLVIVLIAVIFLVVWDRHRTPKPCGEMKKAHLLKVPLILLAGLDHFADLLPLRDFIPEVLETFPKGAGGLFDKKPKRTMRFALSQKVEIGDIEVEAGKDPVLTRKYIQALNDLATQKTFLRGVHTPILAGVKNRAIAASFPFLGAVNWTKDLEAICRNNNVLEALKLHKDSRVRELADVVSKMAIGVSMIDFHAVYTHIDENWDLTIQDAISERDKYDGRSERSEDKNKGDKTMLIIILGIIGVLAALIIGIKVL